MKQLWLMLWLLLAAALPMPAQSPGVAAPVAAARVDRLLGLIQQRLQVSEDVARFKWNRHTPIEDPAREAALLRKVQESNRSGLAPARVDRFFRAQIEASKIVQRELHQLWRTREQGRFEPEPSLEEVRVRLDGLSGELLEALQRAEPYLEDRALLEERSRIILGEGPATRRAIDF